ncbi:MAG: M48 family metalloprotease [Candidatus Omnitrophica bacterium]|nr:M48 family metalloprotease [Candidatus Omnitrophota bacterium]
MLKYIILLSVLILWLGGCATEYNPATQRQELIMISTDQEVKMGTSISRQIEEKLKLSKDERVRQRVDAIGQKIAALCERKDIVYHFNVLDEKDINAVSLPGGFIYVNQGLLDMVKDNDDELACVIGHEIAHIVAKHSVKKLQGVMGYNFLRVLMGVGGVGGDVSRGADFAFNQLLLAYSREDELLADKLGVTYAKSADYNPEAMITFLEKLRGHERKEPLRPFRYSRTHPYISDRIRIVRQTIYGKIDVIDYLNEEKEGF